MTRSQDRRENEVLLLCARPRLDPQQINRLRALVSEIEWDYLYRLARRHSLVPLLYFQIERAAGELVPPDALRRLKQDYQENIARNLILTDELVSLIKALAATNIEAVPFKGPALALVAYGNPALRRFIDLDLMVRRRDVMAAHDVLIARGYQATGNLDPRQQPILLHSQHNIQFWRDEGRLIVELHWRVAAELFAASVSSDELWHNLETNQLNNTTLKTLAPEDLLFSLCVHGSRHLWERLSWICDVAALVNTSRSFDWRRLLRRAEGADAERMFFLGLYLADNLIGASLPDHVNDRIKSDRAIPILSSGITDRLFNGTEQVPASLREIFRYNFSVRKTWSARLHYCLFVLGPSDSDLGVISLPRFLNFVYYLLRPFRLLWPGPAVKPITQDAHVSPPRK